MGYLVLRRRADCTVYYFCDLQDMVLSVLNYWPVVGRRDEPSGIWSTDRGSGEWLLLDTV